MPELNPNQDNLRDITEIKVSSYAADTSSLIRCGGVLLAIATLHEDPESETNFRYAVGWPADAGTPPEFWTTYAGQH